MMRDNRNLNLMGWFSSSPFYIGPTAAGILIFLLLCATIHCLGLHCMLFTVYFLLWVSNLIDCMAEIIPNDYGPVRCYYFS